MTAETATAPATETTREQSVLNGVAAKTPTPRKGGAVTTTRRAPTKAAPKGKAAPKPASKTTPKATPKPKPAPKPAQADARAEKRALALQVVQAVAAIPGLTKDQKVIVSSWIHHIPADHKEWVKLLPAPDRSDWR
jgi:hypothetical protein